MKLHNKIELAELNDSFFQNIDSFPIFKFKNRVLKRCFDLIISIFLLIITSPIILITVIAIKLESKGPIIYSQLRVGLNNKEFSIYKFRSMTVDAEKDGAKWAQENDPRVTKVGNFIRKTRIDELPQLWNVLIGNMSLIGPRPERKVFIQKLEKEIPYYYYRHKIKPGISGLAQVCYPYGASIEDAKHKQEYDMYYLKYFSPMLDFKIALLTLKTMIFKMGR